MRSSKRLSPGDARTKRHVWRLTIRLAGVMPIVWRTILVRPDTKLAMLHRYAQAAMGWRECHAFAFTIDGRTYGIPDREWADAPKTYDARRYTLERLFSTFPARFDYVYDFGDYWQHLIEIEGVEEPEFRKQYPVCIAGAEPCPPEDCGGPGGYREFLAVLNEGSHPQHADWSAWAKGQQYRRDFRPETATWTMRDVQRGYI
ncbi:MAG: plasmid pRiA4b ORF-3 family protein [Candidatus Baltobacteraceae bacterium]